MTRRLGRRGLLHAAPLAGVSALLAGCGFQPVYMRTASHQAGPAQRELEQVQVRLIGGRPGQQLRQALQENFNSDSGAPAAYDLQVNFSISGEAISIEQTSIATRVRLRGFASWTLFPHDGPQNAITSGSANAVDGFDIYNSQYFAADLGVEAGQSRLATEIAQQITTQLAIYFRQKADKQAG